MTKRGPGRPSRYSGLEAEPTVEALQDEIRRLKRRLKILDPLSDPDRATVTPRPNLSIEQWKALRFEIRRLPGFDLAICFEFQLSGEVV